MGIPEGIANLIPHVLDDSIKFVMLGHLLEDFRIGADVWISVRIIDASAIQKDNFPLVEHLWKLLEEDTFEERLIVVVKMKTTQFAFQVILDVGVKLPLMQSVVWIEFEVLQSK